MTFLNNLSLDKEIEEACTSTLALVRQGVGPEALLYHIYGAIYAGGWRGTGNWKKYDTRRWSVLNTSFLEQLQGAVSFSRMTHGWEMLSSSKGKVLLTRDGINAIAHASQISKEANGRYTVSVQAVQAVMNGFIMVRANNQAIYLDRRYYFAIFPQDAIWLIGEFASCLLESKIPFEIKVASNPCAYWRQDAAVLYSCSDEESKIIEIFKLVAKGREARIRKSNLLLTRAIAGFSRSADQPLDGSSHGQWIAGLLGKAAKLTLSVDNMVEFVWSEVEASGRTRSEPWSINTVT